MTHTPNDLRAIDCPACQTQGKVWAYRRADGSYIVREPYEGPFSGRGGNTEDKLVMCPVCGGHKQVWRRREDHDDTQ